MRSTNYYDSFIEVAEDCPATTGEVPPAKVNAPSVASLQYSLVGREPYARTSDDVLFEVQAIRHGTPASERAAERARFFSTSQPCLRSSPLGKRHGWGIHCDGEGKVALVAIDSPDYRRLATDPTLVHLKAMRSKRS